MVIKHITKIHGAHYFQWTTQPDVHSPFLVFAPLPQARTSADMGHWLGLLLSQTGSKTDPEELTYDYVCADRISSIVTAAKTSL